jgi:hypothetical protein
MVPRCYTVLAGDATWRRQAAGARNYTPQQQQKRHEARLARAGSKAGGSQWLPAELPGRFYGGARPTRLSLYGRPAPLTRPFCAWPHPAFLCIPKHRRSAGVYTLSWAGGITHKLIAMCEHWLPLGIANVSPSLGLRIAASSPALLPLPARRMVLACLELSALAARWPQNAAGGRPPPHSLSNLQSAVAVKTLASRLRSRSAADPSASKSSQICRLQSAMLLWPLNHQNCFGYFTDA